MSPWAVLAIIAAGFAAGAINTIVGSGSLITFPTLLALGYGPIVANVSNTVGLVFGSVSGVVGYRRELEGRWRALAALAVPAIAGGLLGAILLLVLPQRVFRGVVPVLIILALLLVVLQPWLSRRLTVEGRGVPGAQVLLPVAVFATAVYGGYFGAAQGVILMGILTLLVEAPMQVLNGQKNVFAATVNATAAVYFIAAAHVDWQAAGLIAVSSTVGAQAGALVGRRLSPSLLRGVIVVAGVVALVKVLG